jgi:hypothetical protein
MNEKWFGKLKSKKYSETLLEFDLGAGFVLSAFFIFAF